MLSLAPTTTIKPYQNFRSLSELKTVSYPSEKPNTARVAKLSIAVKIPMKQSREPPQTPSWVAGRDEPGWTITDLSETYEALSAIAGKGQYGEAAQAFARLP
ncbi:hypothetical protein MMC13_006053 [Lambiella insularis]|nr:hypothetical protein [Lambiella insularis]